MEAEPSEREHYRIREFIENGIEDSAQALARAGIIPDLELLTLDPGDVDSDEKIAAIVADMEVDDPYFKTLDFTNEENTADASILAAAKAIASAETVTKSQVKTGFRKFADRIKEIGSEAVMKADRKKGMAALISIPLLLTACGTNAQALVPEVYDVPKTQASEIQPDKGPEKQDEPVTVSEHHETTQERFEKKLKEVAESKIARTQEEIRILAAGIGENGAYRYDFGSNFCGPFSAEILTEVGLFKGDIGELYLFEPGKDFGKLDGLFPESEFIIFDHLDPNESIGEYDWKNNPLKPGDFVYLEAKSGGYDSFEHMLVVSEVDEMGRAYSVTNYTEDGGKTFVVDKVLLYDPSDPTAGIFHKWTSREYKDTYGNTGRGGFFIIRPRLDTIKGAVPAS